MMQPLPQTSCLMCPICKEDHWHFSKFDAESLMAAIGLYLAHLVSDHWDELAAARTRLQNAN